MSGCGGGGSRAEGASSSLGWGVAWEVVWARRRASFGWTKHACAHVVRRSLSPTSTIPVNEPRRSKSLWSQLQSNQDAKELELEEARALMKARGLDEDEVEFLQQVREEDELRRRDQEDATRRELEEFAAAKALRRYEMEQRSTEASFAGAAGAAAAAVAAAAGANDKGKQERADSGNDLVRFVCFAVHTLPRGRHDDVMTMLWTLFPTHTHTVNSCPRCLEGVAEAAAAAWRAKRSGASG